MTARRSATVRAPGTCGELAQGIVDDMLVHVTCPVDIFSTITVTVEDSVGPVIAPANKPKTARAVELTLEYLSAQNGARVTVDNPLPIGKGMASSTADVAGAIAATGLALGYPLSPRLISRLAVEVEPSDGIMFPGIAAFSHQDALVATLLGAPPPIDIVVLDFGGTVDTLAFNALDNERTLQATSPHVRQALTLIARGIHEGNPALIGEGATLSALANQRLLPKPQLPAVLQFAERAGALGVNVAHSGTVIGVLLNPDAPSTEKVLHAARAEFTDIAWSCTTRLIGGGLLTASPFSPHT